MKLDISLSRKAIDKHISIASCEEGLYQASETHTFHETIFISSCRLHNKGQE